MLALKKDSENKGQSKENEDFKLDLPTRSRIFVKQILCSFYRLL